MLFVIYEPNKASRFLFEKMGYSEMRSIKFPGISTYKLDVPPEYSIKPVDTKKINDAVNVNEYNWIQALHAFYRQTFGSRQRFIPGYGPKTSDSQRQRE